ncbi:ring canal kelch homolog [Paramacrobiotus metropolitanus]|uniref:ring canal kelch homolog n=1 Tax=Paramacrobiotus metropolitanus TaxID=2943436 RepID=UPI0024458D24|nr:ring canal kelch homolog [Paramacrobiotus metropolitanus]XP_055329806.1 ring canal kelch homolog [Paramacrobiotus metropolitanus]
METGMGSVAESAGKRKAEDAGDSPAKSVCIKPDSGPGAGASVSGGEPEQRPPPQLVAVVTGEFVLYSPWSKVEALGLPCHRQDHECHVALPAHIDPWAAHLVLQGVLNPRLPLDASVQGKGIGSTGSQLQAAAAFFKIPLPVTLQGQDAVDKAARQTASTACQATQAIKTVTTPSVPSNGVSPPAAAPPASSTAAKPLGNVSQSNPPPADPMMAYTHLSLAELLAMMRQNFLPVSSEMEVYQRVMIWCHVDYPARWTAEILQAVLPELRWDLLPGVLPLAILTATGPLRDVLLDLQTRLFPPGLPRLTATPRERHVTQVACLFFADRHQTSLRLYDARQNKLYPVKLPTELQTWNTLKEMGPVVNNRVWFRIEHGSQLRTYALVMDDDLAKTEMEYVCEEMTVGAGSPLVSLNGLVFGWNTGATKSAVSYTFDPASRHFKQDVRSPKRIRKEAAFDVWHHYFIILGGYPAKGRNRSVLATGDMYDAATDQWSELPAMFSPRCSFAAKVFNGYLYVTGGVGLGSAVRSSCERLQLGVTGAQWQRLPDLAVPRYGHCMFALDDKLYVCGGCSRDGVPLTAMEVYDATVNRWSSARPTEGPGARSSPVSTCVTLTVNHKLLS